MHAASLPVASAGTCSVPGESTPESEQQGKVSTSIRSHEVIDTIHSPRRVSRASGK